MPTRLASLGVLALFVAGCSGGVTAAGSPARPTPTVASASPHVSAKPSKDATPSVGQRVDTNDDDSTGTATVLKFRQPLPSRFPPDRKGFEYAGIEIKRCFDAITAEQGIAVGWEPWSLVFKNGNVIQPPSSWSAEHFSVALYPRDRPVKDGQCVRGWIPFEVRKGAKPATVSYIAEDADPLEWDIR